MSQAEEAISRNIQRAMSDDGPPRIRADMELVILAKDSAKGVVLVGGLGPFGVGRMWFKATDHFRQKATYAEAPEVAYVKKEKR